MGKILEKENLVGRKMEEIKLKYVFTTSIILLIFYCLFQITLFIGNAFISDSQRLEDETTILKVMIRDTCNVNFEISDINQVSETGRDKTYTFVVDEKFKGRVSLAKNWKSRNNCYIDMEVR